ncbi:SatD family protein [Trueperella bonasi]|nr:SatD family protein [Trueperella bonasi]
MKEESTYVAVIGDLVASRGSARKSSHSTLMEALKYLPMGISPIAPTVGDEVQGVFGRLAEAIKATHLLRLRMLSHGSDIRFGIGLGDIEEIGDGIQDGSAWWDARAALEDVQQLYQTSGWSGVRTGVNHDDPRLAPSLQLIDVSVSELKPSVVRTLLGLLTGESNQETAIAVGISPSANSQRVQTNQLRPLAAAMVSHWPHSS